jgi:hypothetical protein
MRYLETVEEGPRAPFWEKSKTGPYLQTFPAFSGINGKHCAKQVSGFGEDQTPESRHANDETPPTDFEPDGHCRLQTLPGIAVKQLPDTNAAPFSVALMAGQPWDPYLAPTWSTAVCISLSVRAPEKRATS